MLVSSIVNIVSSPGAVSRILARGPPAVRGKPTQGHFASAACLSSSLSPSHHRISNHTPLIIVADACARALSDVEELSLPVIPATGWIVAPPGLRGGQRTSSTALMGIQQPEYLFRTYCNKFYRTGLRGPSHGACVSISRLLSLSSHVFRALKAV